MGQAAVAGLKRRYSNAGTFEFLSIPDATTIHGGQHRIQVEHPVTRRSPESTLVQQQQQGRRPGEKLTFGQQDITFTATL